LVRVVAVRFDKVDGAVIDQSLLQNEFHPEAVVSRREHLRVGQFAVSGAKAVLHMRHKTTACCKVDQLFPVAFAVLGRYPTSKPAPCRVLCVCVSSRTRGSRFCREWAGTYVRDAAKQGNSNHDEHLPADGTSCWRFDFSAWHRQPSICGST
jgi:hypothetical protein